VRNDSGADRDQYDVLGIDEPVILPADNENEFLQNWALSAVEIVADDHAKKFCILAEPIPSGGFGRAMISGVCPAVVIREAGEDAEYAGVEDGEVTLKAGETGARIIWEESGAADGAPRWALVQAPQGGEPSTGNETARVAVVSATQTHSGLPTIDGVALADGDVVFDWRNTTQNLRGLWTAHSGAWTRAGTLVSGMLITVREGTARKNTLWVLTTNDPIVVGTTNLTFVQIVQNTPFLTVRAKSSNSLTHSGEQTIDTIACVEGDLVFDLPNVYTVATGTWSLSASSPNVVYVLEGSANGPMAWAKQKSGTYAPIAGAYS